GDLYVVPVDGSAAAAPVGATPKVGRIGPRWVAGGTHLAYTRAGTPADGGDPKNANDVAVIRPDGGGAANLVSGDAVNTVVGAAGPGGSCAIGRAADARAGLAAACGAIAIALAARRRRRA